MTMPPLDTSLHWLQMYAVKHRVTGDHLADKEPKASVEHLPITTWMPSDADCTKLREELCSMAALIIISQLPQLKWLQNVVPEGIPHQYSLQVAAKSEVLSGLCLCSTYSR